MTPRAASVVLVVSTGLVLALTGCVGGGDSDPTSTPTRSASVPSATSSPTDAPTPTASSGPPASDVPTADPAPVSPVPVPTDEAGGWTDDTAYDACVEAAGAALGEDYTWYPRSSQALFTAGAGLSIDVDGVFSGSDVGIAKVTFRCSVAGTPSSPQVSGEIVS